MKKTVTLCISLAIIATASQAQIERKIDSSESRQGMQKEKQHQKKQLTAHLSKEQMQQLKAQRQAGKAQIEAIENDDKLSSAEKEQKIKAIKASQKAALKAMINESPKKDVQSKPNPGSAPSSAKARKKEMYRQMKLTPEQQAQLKAQHADTRAKVDAIKANSSLSETQKKTQIKEVLQNAEANKKNFLSPEQQSIMKQHRKAMRGQHGKRKMMQR